MDIIFICLSFFGVIVVVLSLTIRGRGHRNSKGNVENITPRNYKDERDEFSLPRMKINSSKNVINGAGDGLERGVTVTKFVKSTKQPRGGFINKKELKEVTLNDGVVLSENENLHASIVGLAVDYLTRYYLTGNSDEAFDISKKGAALIRQSDKANRLISSIGELDEKTVSAACKLSGYDVVYRSGPMGFKDVDTILPDAETVFNIITMVRRSVNFFKENEVMFYGMTFEGGYTKEINKGDADYMSHGTLWDMKVSKNSIAKEQTLQLVIYSILANRCGKYPEVVSLGIFNPRKNTSYVCDIKDLDQSTINEIKKIIGA